MQDLAHHEANRVERTLVRRNEGLDDLCKDKLRALEFRSAESSLRETELLTAARQTRIEMRDMILISS